MKINYFTEDQMRKIYNVLVQEYEDPGNVLIEILAQTGIRTQALIRCRVMDFDRTSHRLTIHIGAKGSESRTCPLGFRLANRLNDLIDAKKLRPIDYIGNILSNKAEPESLARMLRKHFDTIKAYIFVGQKLPCLHGFRHTVAKKIYDKTRDIYAVKLALGHVSIISTERYMTAMSHEKIHSMLTERY